MKSGRTQTIIDYIMRVFATSADKCLENDIERLSASGNSALRWVAYA